MSDLKIDEMIPEPMRDIEVVTFCTWCRMTHPDGTQDFFSTCNGHETMERAIWCFESMRDLRIRLSKEHTKEGSRSEYFIVKETKRQLLETVENDNAS